MFTRYRGWGSLCLGVWLAACTPAPIVPVPVDPPGRTIFHVIGVYRGEPPFWEPAGFQTEHCMRLFDPDCRDAWLGLHEYEVEITITDTRGPLILGLSAWDRTRWFLDVKEGVRIERIILSGIRAQFIEGVPEGTLLDVHTRLLSPCRDCSQSPDGFFDYRRPHPRYATQVGQPVDSFQGAFQRRWFRLNEGTWGVIEH